jgi:osmotically-inducible protein OsmY
LFWYLEKEMNTTYKTVPNRITRSDESLLNEIWGALWKEETIRSIDFNDITVSALDSEVFLEGHVTRSRIKQRVEDIARSVPGVMEVQNELVADSDLVVEVAQALSKDERTRPYVLYIGSDHGWVSLSGKVPNQEIQSAAEEVAGRIPSVRGVISLPALPGESAGPLRRAVQPRIGARVYGERGQAGVVTQVILNPRNRLASHVVVSADYDVEGWPVIGEYVLPVEAIARVNEDSLILARNGSPLKAYPAFDPEDYPQAPSTWRSPYPYTPGTVRRPFNEIPEADRGLAKPDELKLEIVVGHVQVNIYKETVHEAK